MMVGDNLFYVEFHNYDEIPDIVWAGDDLEAGMRIASGTVTNPDNYYTLRVNNNQLNRLLEVFKEREQAIAEISRLLTDLQSVSTQLSKRKGFAGGSY